LRIGFTLLPVCATQTDDPIDISAHGVTSCKRLIADPAHGQPSLFAVIDAVIRLAQDLGIPLIESLVPREMLYIADEVFFSGTAAEITPIRSIDRIQIGKGYRGPVAEKLQKEFFAIVNGTKPDRHHWLSVVNVPKPVGVAS